MKALQEEPLKLISGVAKSIDGFAIGDLHERILPIAFTTIFDYLFLLREACMSLATAAGSALVFLAAAVSDFYVPEASMATEKIQSRAHDGLQIHLQNVPKLLGEVKATWAPRAFIVSFKLETNMNILLAKAAGAIAKYDMDAVVSNQLQTIRDLVTVIRKIPGQKIKIEKESIDGDESEPIGVSGVQSDCVERGSRAALDPLLIEHIIALHTSHMQEPGSGTATGTFDESDPQAPPDKKAKKSWPI